MGVTFPVVIEPGGVGISSLASTDHAYGRTKHVLDTNDYDGSPTYWFEINVINLDTDSAGKEVRLVDSGGTAKCTITVPASTGTAGNYTRIRSSSAFTPVTGSETYRIELEGTNAANDLQVIRWRWIIFQTNATKTRICYGMGFADLAGCNNVEIGGAAPLWGTGHGSFLTDTYNVQNMFKFVDGQFAGDTVQYELETCAYYNGSDPTHGHIALLAHDDSDPVNAVLCEILVDEGATQDVYRVTIDQESEYWVDGMDFEMSVKGEQFLRNCQCYNIAVYITITGLSKVRTYWCLHGGWNGLTPHDAEEGRMLYTASDYQEPTGFYAACVSYIGGSAGNGHEFNHFGTSDGPGGTGTQLLEYQAPSGGDKDYEEWSAGTLTDGRRYGGGFWRTNNAMEICSQWLILEMEFTPDHTLQLVEDFTFGEDLPAPVAIDYKSAPQLVEGFTFGDVPLIGESLGYRDLQTEENFTFGEDPIIGDSYQYHLLQTEEDFTFGEDFDWVKGEAFGPKTLVIGYMALTPGTEYVAGKGIRHPERFFKGEVDRFGIVTRSVAVPAGMLQIGDAVVEMADPDNEWRKAYAAMPPQNREMWLKIGSEGISERLFYMAYSGFIFHADFPPGKAKIYLRDNTFKFFNDEIPSLLLREVYDDPALGDNLVRRTAGAYDEEEVFSPIVFGMVESTDAETLGAMNAVRLNGTDFNLCRWAIDQDLVTVYGKGQDDDDFAEIGGYTFVTETKTEGDVTWTLTHIRFGSEKEDGYEVRWDGGGLLDDEGEVIRNPAELVRQYLIQVVGKDEESLSRPSFDRAVELLDSIAGGNFETSSGDGYLWDGSIEKKMSHKEALARLCKPILLLYTDKWGLMAVKYIGDSPSEMPLLDDVQDIYVKSETHALGQPVVNVLEYLYGRMFSTQKWGGEETYRDTASIDRFAKEMKDEMPLWFCRDPLTALGCVRDFMEFTQPESYRIVFSAPGQRRTPYIELTNSILITSYSGIDETGGGYVGKEFLVHKTEFDLDTKKLNIHAIARVPAIKAIGGLNGAETRDSRIGPYYRGGGNFFVATRSGGFYWQTQGRLDMWATEDYGRTWAKADDGNNPDFMDEGLDIVAHDCYPDRQDPSKLLVVTQTELGEVMYHQFDMDEMRWVFTDRQVWAGLSGFDGAGMAQIDRSRTKGRLGCFFGGEQEPQISGAWQSANRTYFSYSDDDGLTWSSRQKVPAEPTTICRQGMYYEYTGGRIVAGLGDRFHLFYEREPGDHVGGRRDGFFRTVDSNGNLLGEVKFLEAIGGQYYPTSLNFGRIGERINSEGELELAIPMKSGGPCGAGGGFWWLSTDSGSGTLTLPGDEGGFDALSPWIVNQGLGNDNPALTILADPIDNSWHMFSANRYTIRDFAYNSTTWYFHQTGTCSPDQAEAEHFIMGHKAAFMFMTGYWNVVYILGHAYIAQLTHGKPGTSWDWVFTLKRIEDLPEPITWNEVLAELNG